MVSKQATIRLSTKDQLAMFRCAFYTKMGVVNEETKPTDRQCIEWLQRVCAQAEHRTDPKFTMLVHEPIKVKTVLRSTPELEVRRFELVIEVPEWRDLPA